MWCYLTVGVAMDVTMSHSLRANVTVLRPKGSGTGHGQGSLTTARKFGLMLQ